MSRELAPDDGVSVGAAADVLTQAYELRDRADALAKEVGRLFVAHENHMRRRELSADGFRAHTKSPRFSEPNPVAIPCNSHDFAPRPEPAPMCADDEPDA